jgi:hypothetical protein
MTSIQGESLEPPATLHILTPALAFGKMGKPTTSLKAGWFREYLATDGTSERHCFISASNSLISG